MSENFCINIHPIIKLYIAMKILMWNTSFRKYLLGDLWEWRDWVICNWGTFLQLLNSLQISLLLLLQDISRQARLRIWLHQLMLAHKEQNMLIAVICRNPHAWPTRSPDLTSLAYFLCGRMKDVVFRQKSLTR